MGTSENPWRISIRTEGYQRKPRGFSLTLLASLDQPDARIDELWAKEAEDRLAAFEAGRMKAYPRIRSSRSLDRRLSRNVWEAQSSCSYNQERFEPAAHPCRGPGGRAGN